MTRTARVALTLLPVSLALLLVTGYRTDVSVRVDAAAVTFSVDGQALSVKRTSARLAGVELRSRPSAFPMGASDLTVTAAGGPAFNLSIPRRFSFGQVAHAATSDWWVDSFAREETVASHRLDVGLPVELRVTLTGRSLMPTRLVLFLSGENPAPAEPEPVFLQLRSGFIRNELEIVDAGGRTLAETQLLHRPGRLLRNLFDLPAQGLLAACLLLLGASALRRLSGEASAPAPEAIPRRLRPVLVAAPLLLGSLLLTLHTARDVLDELPHFPDDFCYVVQARWLLAGRLWLDLPSYASHLWAPYTFHDVVAGRWLTQYPVGWPLLLAPALALGAAWALPPLLGALGAFVTYRLGRDLYGAGTGLIALLLTVLSPVLTLLSSSLMSHAAASLLLALFVLGFLRGWEGARGGPLFLAGLSLGYAFGIRPLTAVAVAVPAGLLLLADLYGEPSRRRWRALGLLVAGGLAGSLPALVGNALVTHDPFSFAYVAWGGVRWSLSSLPQGLQVSERTLALMGPMAFGWGWDVLPAEIGLFLTYAFALVPFLTGRATRADALLAGTYVSVVLAHLPHTITGAHGYGPRFYADVLFALVLLSARGLTILALEGGRRGPLAVAALLATLALPTAATLPRRVALYAGYNTVTGVLEREVARQQATDGVLVLERAHVIDWTMAARLVPADYATARLPVVAGPWNDPELVKAFPRRDFWVFTGKELVRIPASSLP